MSDPAASLQARRAQALAQRAAEARARTTATVIGVTGSSGKTTTTALLAHILATKGRVMPLVELSFVQMIQSVTIRAASGYDFEVVELGIGLEPMRDFANVLRPDVAVVTMIAMEHKSKFRTLYAIAAEKGELLAAMRPGGFVALNGDDARVASMPVPAGVRTVRFGQAEGNDYRVLATSGTFPERLRLDLAWSGRTLPLRTNFVGRHFWLPTAAAAAVALELGVAPEDVAERIATFTPKLERCGVVSIPKGPHFILDTIKAPWHSLPLAFELMAPIQAPRKRVVLGHMSDFAGSDSKYRDAYRMARAVADEVIFVGDHAHRAKPSARELAEGRFHQFATTEQACEYVRRSAIPDEVILLKGSVDLHLERIALAWQYDVRCWIPACGNKFGCITCNRYLESRRTGTAASLE